MSGVAELVVMYGRNSTELYDMAIVLGPLETLSLAIATLGMKLFPAMKNVEHDLI